MTQTVSPAAFFGSAYDEAMALLLEMRHYVAHVMEGDSNALDFEDRLRLARETMRVTTRLSHVMAWLLTQKAVQSGEISTQEAQHEPFRLSGKSICLDDRESLSDGLPPRLCELLERSHALYARVERLDTMIRSVAG